MAGLYPKQGYYHVCNTAWLVGSVALTIGEQALIDLFSVMTQEYNVSNYFHIYFDK